MKRSPSQLTNVELLAEVKRLAKCERETTATLVAHLIEIEVRGLFHVEGCSSMFSYCTEVLRLSEAATFKRLRAARAARQNPQILVDLATGALSLSAIKLLAPHLHPANQEQLLDASRHKSKREVEKLIRSLDPLPDAPSTVRKLPAKSVEPPAPNVLLGPAVAAGPGKAVVETPRAAIAPLAPERYKVQFTASEAVHARLRHGVVAYALGGEATVENIALRCRAHNQFEARCEFGRWEAGAASGRG